LVGTSEVSAGTYDVTYQILVQNYGNVPLDSVQATDDLASTFPPPTTFTVQSLTSPDFAVNSGYNGGSDIDLLNGTDTLGVGGSGVIDLVIRVIPGEAGPFNNTAIASGDSPGGTPTDDDSQNGADPDPDDDGDPTNNDVPTPVDFGANLFDPPFGLKVFDDSGLPMLRWIMTWINDSNVAAVNARVADPIPAGVIYSPAGASSGYPVPVGAPPGSTNVGVTCEPDPVSIATITTQSYYEGHNPPATPLGQIIWAGTLGPDLNAVDADTADNELVIRYNVVVDTGTTSVLNVATIDSDLNGNGNTIDPGEQIVATASAQWNLNIGSSARLPDTGFAPGRISLLPIQPDLLAYGATDLTLEIPTQNRAMSIVGVPYTVRGWDVTWLGNQAGYLDGTAFPTWAGNSVITGHVYMQNGLPGPFVNLAKLKYGDRIIIRFAGQRYIYEVRTNRVVSPKDKSVFKHEDYSWLTLVTCRDYNETTDSYDRRLAVRAVLIIVEPDSGSAGK
jgi:LPXTG-site transpeptidase (sortase) family protein